MTLADAQKLAVDFLYAEYPAYKVFTDKERRDINHLARKIVDSLTGCNSVDGSLLIDVMQRRQVS